MLKSRPALVLKTGLPSPLVWEQGRPAASAGRSGNVSI
jgi:hypothetical protein